MIPLDTPAGRDNCGIATTAMLAGVSYREAEALFFLLCGKTDYTDVWDRMSVIEVLGLTILEDTLYGKKPTLASWVNARHVFGREFQVSLTGHVIALRNGLVFDQVFRCGVPVLKSPYKRKRVHAYLQLGYKHEYRR